MQLWIYQIFMIMQLLQLIFQEKNILEKYIIWNKQNPDLIYKNVLDNEKTKIRVELKNEVLNEAKEIAKLELKEELKKKWHFCKLI